jgi:hypothetical protein
MSREKINEKEVVEQLHLGLKPHAVEVTLQGRIDGACKGKNI